MEIIAYDKLQMNSSVVALGKFEGLHQGHMLLINKVTSLSNESGYKSVVFTININRKQRINLPNERFALLENAGVDIAAECDFSEEFASISYDKFIKNILIDKLHAKYVVVGEDFQFGYKRLGTVSNLKEYGNKFGFEVISFDKMKYNNEIISSSAIRELISNGMVDDVHGMLGRYYSVTGTVLYGKQLGRTIGFPTANISVDSGKLLPKFGVYQTKVQIDGKYYKGMTNIGNNPTVDDSDNIFIETHIIDYDGDLYDKEITLEFVKYIRDEKKFSGIEELKNQLNKDKETIMNSIVE